MVALSQIRRVIYFGKKFLGNSFFGDAVDAYVNGEPKNELTTKFEAKFRICESYMLEIYRSRALMSFLALVFGCFFAFNSIENSFAENSKSYKIWHDFSEEDIDLLKKVAKSISGKNYNEALTLISTKKKLAKAQGNLNERLWFLDSLYDIVLWNKFSNKNITQSFSDISRFVIDNPFYPNLRELKKNTENSAVVSHSSYNVVEKYFSTYPAETLESKLFLIEAMIEDIAAQDQNDPQKDREKSDLRATIASTWIKEVFSEEQEISFLNRYGSYLNELDHANRVEQLLWNGKNEEARRIFHLLDRDHAFFFEKIVELQDAKYIDKILFDIPRKLRATELLSYKRVLWYKSQDRLEDLIDVMQNLPNNLQSPEKWWSLRKLYGREMLKRKEYKIAYLLFSKHQLSTKSPDFWEAEWTSGWIALRFLNKPATAYGHFDSLYRNVSQPVTVSRAAYWLGMAAHEMKEYGKANEWLNVASRYPTFFYGQLAIHKKRVFDKTNSAPDFSLPKDPESTRADIIFVAESRAVKIAYLLAITGDKSNAAKIFEWAVNNSSAEGQIAAIMHLVDEIHDRELSYKVSRAASRKNVFFVKEKFPIIKEIPNDDLAPLVHAIVKQESGFIPTAMSQVGALGFMQIMPNTAKLVCTEAGIHYDKNRLSSDVSYNLKLGSFYLRKLINRFDGSEILAIASYNAGPNASQRWINEFYDPRKEEDIDQIVDWIELITYSETRNYVQRVLENLLIYQHLLHGNVRNIN